MTYCSGEQGMIGATRGRLDAGAGWLRCGLILSVTILAGWIAPGLAAGPSPVANMARPEANNRGLVELEIDGSAGISVRIAEDLAGLIDDGATRRVLPVVGRSARQNLTDLVQLRGIDMAILQTDMLDDLRQQRTVPGLESSFTYVARLYNDEFHLIAGSGINSIGDLSHRRVAIGIRGSGTSITAERLFGLLKIEIEPVYERPEIALSRLRDHDVDAVAFVAGKPAPLFQGLPRDDTLHLVAIPLNAGVIKTYVPTSLTAEDYPNLIPSGQTIDTIAVGTLLAVAKLPTDSERYRAVSNFVETFFTQFATLLEPGHHPKWREINLAANAPGWTRFPPAQAWLDRNAPVARVAPQDMKTLFARFLDFRQHASGGTLVTEEEKQEMFNEFQRWQAGQAH
jgi:TRAP-type uncharacterized transport system substrate-binding protein